MKWYVVFVGRKLGVYGDWNSCHAQVTGFSHACYKSFKTEQEAVQAYRRHLGESKKSDGAQEAAQFDESQAPQNGCGSFVYFLVIIAVLAIWVKSLM